MVVALASTGLACEWDPAATDVDVLRTCEGEVASIGIGYSDGSAIAADPVDGAVYEGTPERDVVIIASGPVTYLGLGGGDLVCVRNLGGSAPEAIATVDTGDGDARVVNEGTLRMDVELGDGTNVVETGEGSSTVIGGPGDDTVIGGPGADQISGGDGDDVLEGGGGDDQLAGGAGVDQLDGGDGTDVLEGGGDDDSLLGGADGDTLDGGDGADELDGGDGTDVLDGGAGDDSLVGGDGDDELLGGTGMDALDGGRGVDAMTGGPDADVLDSGDGDDDAHGGDGDDRILGGPGADTLHGDAGDDVLLGGDGVDACTGGTGGELDGDAAFSCETTPDVEQVGLRIVAPSTGERVFDQAAVVVEHDDLPGAASVEISIGNDVVATGPFGAEAIPVDLTERSAGPITLTVEVIDDEGSVVSSSSVAVERELVAGPSAADDLAERFEAGTITTDEYLVSGFVATMGQPTSVGNDEATGRALDQLTSSWFQGSIDARIALLELHRVTPAPGADLDHFRPTVVLAPDPPPANEKPGTPPVGRAAGQADCDVVGPLTWFAGQIFETTFCSYWLAPEAFPTDALPASAGSLSEIIWYVGTEVDRTDSDDDGVPDNIYAATIRAWETEALLEDRGFRLPGVHRDDDVPLTLFVSGIDQPAYSSPFDEAEGNVLGLDVTGGLGRETRFGHPIRLKAGHLEQTLVHELAHTFQWDSINWTWDVGTGSNGKRSVAFYESAANWATHEYSTHYLPGGTPYTARFGYGAEAAAEEFLADPSDAFLAYSGGKVSTSDEAYAYFPALEWLDEHGGAAGPVSTSGLIQRTVESYEDHRWGADPIDLLEDQVDDGQFGNDGEGMGKAWVRMWAALYLLDEGEDGGPFDDDRFRWAKFWDAETDAWRGALAGVDGADGDAAGPAERLPRLDVPMQITDDVGALFLTDEFELDRGGAGFQDFLMPEGRNGTIRFTVDGGRGDKYEAFTILATEEGVPDVCLDAAEDPMIQVSDGEKEDGDVSFLVDFTVDCPIASVGVVHIDPNSGESDDFRILAELVSSEEPSPVPRNLVAPTIGKSSFFDRPTFELWDEGSWSIQPGSFTYRWLYCDASGNGCVAAEDEWSSCLPTRWADRGRTARLEVVGVGEYGASEPVRTNFLAIDDVDFAALPDPEVPYHFDDPTPPSLPGSPTLLSRLPDGSQDPAGAFTSSISGNGRVAYGHSFGTPSFHDVSTQRRMWSPGGAGGMSFSDDARYATYTSYASGGNAQVVRDLGCGGYRNIAVNPGSGRRPGIYYNVSDGRMSADGRYTTFSLAAHQRFPDETFFAGTASNVYRYDQETGALDLVSATQGDQVGDADSGTSDVSDDGQKVSFWTSATNLGADPATGGDQVVVKDMATGSVTVVSSGIPRRTADTHIEGGQVACSCGEGPIRISDDGAYVSYMANGIFLTGGPNPNEDRIESRMYRGSSSGGSNLLVNADPHLFHGRDASMSGDGQWLVFESQEAFVGIDTNGECDTYLTEIGTGTYTLASQVPGGGVGDGSGCALSSAPDISRDGRYVTFISEATNMLPVDVNDWTGDLWVFERSTGP